MNRLTFKKGWSLLDANEKRRALLVLAVIVTSALTSALMVGSIMPFLTILSDPSRIREVEALAAAYKFGGFTSDYAFIVAVGLASLLTILVANAFQMLRLYLVTEFATMRMHTLSTRLLSVYLKQPYEYFLDKNSGELGTQILSETQQVVQLFYRPAAEAIAAVFTVVAILALLVWINPIVATIALVTAGTLYIGAYVLSRKAVRRFGSVRAAANRSRFRIANEALSGVKEVKLLGREANYIESYSSPSLRMATAEAMAIFIGTLPQYVMQIVAFGGMIIMVLILIEPSTLDENATLATLAPLLGVFAFGGQKLIPELAKLYTGATQLNYGAPIVETMHKDLDGEQLLPQMPAQNTVRMGLKYSFEMRDINYAYPNAEATALVGVSISIKAGERIGIVGGSGAGKTTLADMIMGLLNPISGNIFVDGTKINEQNLRAWQRSVGYVQQEIYLSDASIFENIALGILSDHIDKERAIEAAQMAKLDAFVRQELPDGYETIVGERGMRLSGGQRQRIGIARALYGRADLIVFDEATSALDNLTERQVMSSLDTLPSNKTAILIAHRLTTVEKCDRLIVMDQGRVVGVGTWDELIAENAHFQRLTSAVETPDEVVK